jgi:spermidine/putrescine transport system permease protein
MSVSNKSVEILSSADLEKRQHGNRDLFKHTMRMPIVVWQSLFFIAPLFFLVAMSFFIVRNYRMTEAFEMKNWLKMMSRDYFWDSYGLTIGLATMATLVVMSVAFPAAYTLAFKVSEQTRRWAIFLLIIPFFTSYLVRIFSWYVILAESGVINAMLGYIGLGPFIMLNTKFGTIVGYMTLTLPLVIILQTFSLAHIDRNLLEAAHNLGCRPWRTIIRVVLPLAKTGFIISAVFCFILSFGDFVSPYYLGGSKPPTLPILIVDTVKSGQQWPRAAVVAVVMMVTLFIVAFGGIATAYRRRVS